MDTAEQYAHDLVKVLAQRPDAIDVARYTLRKLERCAGMTAHCVVCSNGFERRCSSQRYCSVKCRERYQYVTYKQGKR